MKANLDRIDLKIIEILQQEGKITNLQLSQRIGLSPAPTLERVRKLERNRIIEGYHAKVNEEALGLGISAIIQVRLHYQKENVDQILITNVGTIPEIVECYQLLGTTDYLIKVVVQDIKALDRLITGKLSKIEGVGNLQTLVVLKKVKDSKLLPIDYDKLS